MFNYKSCQKEKKKKEQKKQPSPLSSLRWSQIWVYYQSVESTLGLKAAVNEQTAFHELTALSPAERPPSPFCLSGPCWPLKPGSVPRPQQRAGSERGEQPGLGLPPAALWRYRTHCPRAWHTRHAISFRPFGEPAGLACSPHLTQVTLRLRQ